MISIKGGNSKKDRITFVDSKFSATAIRSANGTIQTKVIEKKDVTGGITREEIITVLVVFLGISLIKVWGIMPFIDNESTKVYLYLIPAVIYSWFVIYSIKCTRPEIGEEGLKNHGAEHMVYSAYKKLKRIPMVEEAKQFSRINGNCGVCVFSGIITAQIIGFLVYKYVGYQISEIVLFVVPMLLWNCFPFNVLGKIAQFWTTKQPDDANIELAIAAINALEERYVVLEKLRRAFGLFL